ncbi:MAG: FAD-dependent oxidoreductase [Cellulomonas iranensis]|uniref:FAD-dependent oxidoreductase n=1 Tax=Cellulomonas iranensis TaxID=76862 RepID=UPI001B14B244|nr:FAD-dependent oxidoreductase [Cellulomonas iranensis]MBO9569798.1 FAD-dependent oxidoreductase [Cellulomonas iranensis]
MTEHVDHVVVGGGVMGSAAAWHLARRGRDVVLLERFAPGHVHGASHGASRIYRTTYPEPVYLDLAQEALRWWRELEAATGVALLEITGGVSHAHAGTPSAARAEAVAAAFAARGIAHAWLTPDAAAERWPGLRFEGRVLHETATAGRLHADRAVTALQRAAAAHGADVRHEAPVRHLEPVPGGVRVVTRHGDLVARRVVVTVGAWSAGLVGPLLAAPPAGSRTGPHVGPEDVLPLVVTQEQPAHLAARDPALLATWPSFTHDPGPAAGWPSGVYGLVTPGEGVKVGFHGVGPVTDPDRRTYRPEPAQLAALREYVRTWLPGLDPDDLAPVSCTYTTTPDHDFVLDRRGPLVVGAGFSGHGFKFAPAVGRVLADLATGDAPGPAPFALARFARSRPVPARPARAAVPTPRG